MKKICLFIALSVMISCAHEEDNLFDMSAAQRLNESVKSYHDLLESSEFGWALEFYIGNEDSPTSFVTTTKFYSGNVDMVAEIQMDENHSMSSYEPTYEVFTSKYSVNGEQGIVLSFDTHNLPIHYYTEPYSFLGTNPNGYGGDFEFCLLKTSEDLDTIYMRGKRYGRDTRLVRIHEEGGNYMRALYRMKDLSLFDLGQMTFDNKSYTIDIYRKRLVIEMDHENQIADQHFFVYNNKGFRLLKPVMFNGCWLESFEFDNETGVISSQDGRAIAHFPSPYEQIANTKLDWYIKNTDKSNNFTAKYNAIASHMLMPPRFPLPQIFIGTSISRDYSYGILDKKLCFSFRWFFSGLYGHIQERYLIEMGIDKEKNLIYFNAIEPGGGWGNYFYPASGISMINDEKAYIDEIVKHSPYKVEFSMDGIRVKEAKLISENDNSIFFTLEERELNDNILLLK